MQTSAAQARQKESSKKEQSLSAAVELCDLAEIEMLLADGVDVNAGNESGMTPLMRAACTGRTEIIQRLLENGADLNSKRSDGFTALSFAAFFGHADAVRLLLANGADVSARSKFGTSAEMWARARGFNEVVALLRQVKTGAISPFAPTPRHAKLTGVSSVKKPTPVAAEAAGRDALREPLEQFEKKPVTAFDVADIWASDDLEPEPGKRAPALPEDGLDYLPEISPDLEFSAEPEPPPRSWTRLALLTIIVMLVSGLATFGVLELLHARTATHDAQVSEPGSTLPLPVEVAPPKTERAPVNSSVVTEPEVNKSPLANVAEPSGLPAHPALKTRRGARNEFPAQGPKSGSGIVTLSTADGLGVEDITAAEASPAPITVENTRPREVMPATSQSAERTATQPTNAPVTSERPKRKVIQWP